VPCSRELDTSSPGVTAPFGVLYAMGYRGIGFHVPPSAFQVSLPTLGVFATSPSPPAFGEWFILPGASVRLQSMTEPARRSSSRKCGSSHEVSVPFRASSTRVRSSRRVPIRRRLPSQGFRNLSTVSSPECLAGFFHPAGTPRLPPSGLFSFQGAVPPLGGRCPLVVALVSPLPCESEKT
jgi:hypothetical protein